MATHTEVTASVNRILTKCEHVLTRKGIGYAGDSVDRLAAFKNAVIVDTFRHHTADPKLILWGYLLKHLTSINQMCRSNRKFDRSKWDEKIVDSINYLLLLSAIVDEDIANTDELAEEAEEEESCEDTDDAKGEQE